MASLVFSLSFSFYSFPAKHDSITTMGSHAHQMLTYASFLVAKIWLGTNQVKRNVHSTTEEELSRKKESKAKIKIWSRIHLQQDVSSPRRGIQESVYGQPSEDVASGKFQVIIYIPMAPTHLSSQLLPGCSYHQLDWFSLLNSFSSCRCSYPTVCCLQPLGPKCWELRLTISLHK